MFASCNNDKKDDKAKTDDPGKIESTVKETPKATLAAHVCTDQCKEGNHLYAHGEEGHTCGDAFGTSFSFWVLYFLVLEQQLFVLESDR